MHAYIHTCIYIICISVSVCVWVSECECNVIRMYIYIYICSQFYTIIYILQLYKERSREKDISPDPFSWDWKQLLQSSRPPAQYMAVDLTLPSKKNTRPSTEHNLSALFNCFFPVRHVFPVFSSCFLSLPGWTSPSLASPRSTVSQARHAAKPSIARAEPQLSAELGSHVVRFFWGKVPNNGK